MVDRTPGRAQEAPPAGLRVELHLDADDATAIRALRWLLRRLRREWGVRCIGLRPLPLDAADGGGR